MIYVRTKIIVNNKPRFVYSNNIRVYKSIIML